MMGDMLSETFKVGDLVWLYTPQVAAKLKKKLAMLWRGSYCFIDKTSDVNHKVQHLWNDKETQLIYVDCLKKAYNPYLVPRTTLKVNADEEDRQVDQIVGEQVQGGDHWFLVQWKGHTDEEQS
ncbi:putative retrovirus-related pol polyprotein from transposon [Balamuthia mandrillaris]